MKTAFPTVSLVVLLAIGVIDLISTAVLHAHGQITELNPLMNFFISKSEWLFAFVKGLTIGMAWGTMAWYAKQNLAFVNKACWVGSAAYVLIWLTWFFSAR
ncbi:MAG TPA: DUF5658 family protein [Fimbriimonas sp.]|nr:DUF5658 family protein [Fimbriimonas sp.]